MSTVVAEIMYVVPEEREKFIEDHLNPSREVEQLVWLHGIRNQSYFELGDFILMTFTYVGENFRGDMAQLAAYPQLSDYFIQTRRKSVPQSELKTTNWWAPLKKWGIVAKDNPLPADSGESTMEEQYHSMTSGNMIPLNEDKMDISYDDDDWSESVHI